MLFWAYLSFITIIVATCGVIVSFGAHSLGGITLWFILGFTAFIGLLTTTSLLGRRNHL